MYRLRPAMTRGCAEQGLASWQSDEVATQPDASRSLSNNGIREAPPPVTRCWAGRRIPELPTVEVPPARIIVGTSGLSAARSDRGKSRSCVEEQRVTWAHFHEKEYEVGFGIELASGGSQRAPVFSCGQVLEKVLGYDATADPSHDHLIWRLLRVPRPAGLRLLPAHWSRGPQPTAGSLPVTPISLILQYKRPEYLFGPTAKQWRMPPLGVPITGLRGLRTISSPERTVALSD